MSTRRVLIVDDQSEVRRVLRSALETLGHDIKVIGVPSGEEAILVVSQQPIDLLVADIRLPGISGLELKERARKRSPEMHLILITGMTDEEIRHKVAKAGADAYFYKPIEIPAFLDTVQELLGIKEPGPALRTKLQEAMEEAPPLPDLVHTGEIGRFLEKRLADLRLETGAVCVALLDDQGQVLARSGDFSNHFSNTGLISSLASICRAAARVASYLDAGVPYDFISFFEPGSIYCMTHAGYTVGLVSVVLSVTWDPERQWKLQRAMREAVLDFRQARPDWAVPPPATDAISTPPVALSSTSDLDSSTSLPDLEAVFSQVSPGQLKPEEVDAYWETAVDQSANISGGTDGISFEKARQMGLAPKDD
jgi:CheY-like chemotaxis protein